MPTVLVVDDEHEIAAAVRSILEDEGFRVETALDGADALERLRRGDVPDLVLSDMMMPRLGGYDLLQRMRAEDRLAEIPVILMSSVPPPAARRSAVWNAFLRKPFTLDELVDTVQRLVGR